MTTINGRACVANGNNLLLDTDFNNLDLWFSNRNWTKQADKYNGLAVMQTTSDWGGISQYVKVKTGEVYTFSLYARYTSGTGNSNMYWSLNTDPESGNAKANTSTVYKNVNLSENWQRISATTTITSDGYIRPRIERTSNNDNPLQIAGMKLEAGTLATPLTPAPVDAVYQNGRQVYGRNLLLDSQAQTQKGAWFTPNNSWTPEQGTYLGSNIFRTNSRWKNARYHYKDLLDRGVINTTDDFTYSIYFRVVGEDPAGMSYATIKFLSAATDKSGFIPLQLTSLKEGQWARAVVTFKFNGAEYDPTKDYDHSIRLEMTAAPKVAGARYEFAAPKLEAGTLATPLTPAPVDKVFSDGRQVYGRNLLRGTSSDLKTKQLTNGWNVGPQATNGDFKIKIVKGQTYTYRAWIDNTNGSDDAFANIRLFPIGATTDFSYGVGILIEKGKAGYSNFVFTPQEDGYIQLVPSAYNEPVNALAGWKEEKLEKGSIATPWTPRQKTPCNLGGVI